MVEKGTNYKYGEGLKEKEEKYNEVLIASECGISFYMEGMPFPPT
jgi:hypothetical protein